MSTAITDQQLQQMYRLAGQPDDLFPVFERTRGFRSWIVVLALIPTLYALRHATLSETDSEWVLRVSDLVQATTLDGVVCPGGEESVPEIKFQPPMGTWLSSLTVRIFPGGGRYPPLVASWLGTALLIAVGYWLCRDLLDERVALWCVILAAGQLVILRQAQTAVPHALGAAMGLLSIRALVRHIDHEPSVIAWQILGGGLALGLCLLVSGPLVIPVMLAQAMYVWGEILKRRSARNPTVPIGPPKKLVLSLLLLWMTCVAAAGWWPMMMASAYGGEFWSSWFHGPPGGISMSLMSALGWNLLAELTPLAGLCVIGAVLTVWSWLRNFRRGDLVLLTWSATSLIWWMTSVAVCRNAAMLPEASRVLFEVSLIFFAARALNEVSRGTLRVLPTAIATLLPMMLNYGRLLFSADEIVPLVFSSTGLLVMILALFLAVCLWNRREFSPHARPRLFAGLFLLILVFANFRTGLSDLEASGTARYASFRDPVIAQGDLLRLRDSLVKIPAPAKSFVILTERTETARLRLELAQHFPEARVSVLPDWNALFAHLETASASDPVVVLVWQSLPNGESHLRSDAWIRQSLDRIPQFDGVDLSILRFLNTAMVTSQRD